MIVTFFSFVPTADLRRSKASGAELHSACHLLVDATEVVCNVALRIDRALVDRSTGVELTMIFYTFSDTRARIAVGLWVTGSEARGAATGRLRLVQATGGRLRIAVDRRRALRC